jgi:RNA polymerase sigma factor (sigma-70 family)
VSDDPAALQRTVRLACQGDTQAFRQLIELTHGKLYRLVRHLTGDAGDAEDVVQETYVRAWQRLGELRDPSAVRGWLSRIAKNLAYDRRRRERSQPTEPATLELLGSRLGERRSAEEQLALASEWAAVRTALAALPDKHREVLLLREVEDMSYDEIADLLGLAVGTVESRLHRARQALAKKLTRGGRR